MKVRGPLFAAFALLVAVAYLCQSARAQTSIPEGQRIIHESWTFKDGAPEAVEALAQTADGSLCLGTPSGLFRFDGLRFELFRPEFREQLPSTNVSALFAPASGGLWIGYRFGGFSFAKNGELRNFLEFDAQEGSTGTVYSFAQDRSGIVWAATTRGIWRFDGSTWQRNPASWNPQLPAGEIGFDRTGILWALTYSRGSTSGRQIFYLLPGGGEFQKAGENLLVEGFTSDADYTVLTTHEKPAPDSGIALDSSLPAWPILKKNSDQIIDRANSIWLLRSNGTVLRHAAGEPLARFVNEASPGNSQLYDLDPYRYSRLVDREGSIWMGDPAGLHRFSYSPLIQPPLPKMEGAYFTVAADDGGVVWISNGNGNGSSTLYRVTDVKVEPQGAQGGLTTFAYRSPDKTFWLGGEGGLWHMVNRRLTRVDFPVEIADRAGTALLSITQDLSAGLWVTFGRAGLYRLAGGVWKAYGGREDLTSGSVFAYTDPAGRVWFGYPNNKVTVLDRERAKTFGPRDGVQVGTVTAFHGRGPQIWIGGEFGIQRFEQGRFHSIHAVDAESLRGISGIVETVNGDLWLNGLGGIIHIRRAEIDKALKEPDYRVSSERFGRRDGLPGLPSQLGKMPTAIEGSDGRLWFTVNNGVVWLDPARASHKVAPPPVTIQSISADDKGYALDHGLKFPAHTSSVQISYAAVSLADPEAIRFRYRLQETDKDWHEAGTSNSVSYRNLPPASYHFVVAASDANGLWSDNTAKAEFTVLPAFYQTAWFRAIMAAAFVALLWAAYRYRMWQVQREARQLRNVIDTIPAYVWSAEPDDSVDFINRRWLEFSGFSPDQALGWGWSDSVHPEDRTRLLESWRNTVISGKPLEAEARMRSADGEYRWLLFRSVPLRDRSGKIVKWYGKSTDIDDRKHAEQERERLLQLEVQIAHINRVSMMGELAASVAHEVNQPLTGIVSNGSACLRFLAGDSPNLEEARESVRDIVRDGKRAGEVIARIRALTKRTALPREKLDLNETTREILAIVGDEARKRNVAIGTQFANDLSPVLGDRVQFQQVLLNLVMNAMEAMSSVDEGARQLLITARNTDQDQVQVTVEDSGAGLDPNIMARIFEPFYTTKSAGMGMGLSICRSILQNHGGRIWATANEGRGTSFHFSLRRYQGEERDAAQAV